jgi:hypothetical protein
MTKGSIPGLDERTRRLYLDRGSWPALRDVQRRIGLRGLFSGLKYHAGRDSLGCAVFWGPYEAAKQILAVGFGAEPGGGWTAPVLGGIAGGSCGILSHLAVGRDERGVGRTD